MFEPRYAILLDGEFVRKRIQKVLGYLPSAIDVADYCDQLIKAFKLSPALLYRVFYYSAEPLTSRTTNPVEGSTVDFGKNKSTPRYKALLDSLDARENFAVRRGELLLQGWRLRRSALESCRKRSNWQIGAGDVEPDIKQKGVDLRIGLDIASLALKRLVSTVIVVTGDSDMVPALKFARREGLRVYLATMGGNARQELKRHADRTDDSKPAKAGGPAPRSSAQPTGGAAPALP